MSVEIKVVQKPGQSFIGALLTGPGNRALWFDQLLKSATPISSVDEFVSLVLQTASSKGQIDSVQINGHGNGTGFRIGEDWIDMGTVERFKPKLARIAPVLSQNASVEVVACEAGQAKQVLQKFSQILGGVRIVGYVNEQSGGWSGSGPATINDPNGSFTSPRPASGSSPASPPPPPPR